MQPSHSQVEELRCDSNAFPPSRWAWYHLDVSQGILEPVDKKTVAVSCGWYDLFCLFLPWNSLDHCHVLELLEELHDLDKLPKVIQKPWNNINVSMSIAWMLCALWHLGAQLWSWYGHIGPISRPHFISLSFKQLSWWSRIHTLKMTFSSLVSSVVSLTKPFMSNKFWKMEPSATLQLQTSPQNGSLIGTLQDLPQLRGRQPRSLFTGYAIWEFPNVKISWSTWEPNPRVPPWASKKKPIQLASRGKRFTS